MNYQNKIWPPFVNVGILSNKKWHSLLQKAPLDMTKQYPKFLA